MGLPVGRRATANAAGDVVAYRNRQLAGPATAAGTKAGPAPGREASPDEVVGSNVAIVQPNTRERERCPGEYAGSGCWRRWRR